MGLAGEGLFFSFVLFGFFFFSPVLERVGKEGFKKKNVSNLLIVYVHQEMKAFLLKTNGENYSPRKEEL